MSEITDKDIREFALGLMPFGYADVECALETIKSAKVTDSLFTLIEEYKESVGAESIEDFDVVAIVYEDIFQTTRTEICEAHDFDILNDTEGSIYVAGNYLATTYDYNSDDIETIREFLKENELQVTDFSEKAQWFFESIDL